MINTTMKFTLPEHRVHVQALGYACGLNDAIFEGTLPVVAKGPVATNDPEQYNKIFDEWFNQGHAFGEHSQQKLRDVLLDTIPHQWWWPVCIAFSSQRFGLDKDERKELINLDPHIERGMTAFQSIYQEYLL